MTKTSIACSSRKRKYPDDEESMAQVFGFRKPNERYKSCIKCRQNSAAQKEQEVICGNCGCVRNGKSIAIHKRRYYCQTSNVKEKPDFEEWLKQQNYAKLPWEYKKIVDGELPADDYKCFIG